MLKRTFLAVLMSLAVFACGCLNPVSLDKYGYIMSIGVDVGMQKKYHVTFLVQKETPKDGQQQTTGGAVIVGADGNNVYDAIRVVSEGVPYELNFSRVNYFVFSEEAARAGMMQDFLSMSASELKLRYSVNLLVAAGRAEDYMASTGSDEEPNIAKLQYSLVEMERTLGIAPAVTLMEFREMAEQGRYDAVVPFGQVDTSIVTDKERQKAAEEGKYPVTHGGDTTGGDIRIGGMRVSVIGSALFDGWKMVGALDSDDTVLILIGRGGFKEGRLTYIDGHGHVVSVALTSLSGPDVDVTLGEAPRFDIAVRLACGVEQDSGSVTDERAMEIIGELRGNLEQNLERIFYGCRDIGCDVFGVGRHASAKCLTAREYEALNWDEAFMRSEASFSVELAAVNELGRKD